MYSIFILIILLSLLIFLLFKVFKLLHIRANAFISIILTLIIIYLILSPEKCIEAALNGSKLIVNSIIPTMFPFMVVCNLLVYIDGISLYSKFFGPIICKPLGLNKSSSFAIIASYLSGYPLGAKYSTNIYEKGYISKNEFSRLINIASNVGPLFLIGAVGTSLLGNTKLGYILLIPSYLSSIFIALITRKKEDSKAPKTTLKSSNQVLNIGEAIRKSIEDACLTLLVLSGYIIIFSVIISIFKNSKIIEYLINYLSNILGISSVFIESLFLGSIELTNGSNIISNSTLNLSTKLSLISFLCSFGGLSIIAQTYSFFYKCNVSFKRYFFYKFLQGIISFIIMYTISLFLPDSITTFATVQNNHMYSNLIPVIIFIILTVISLILSIITKKESNFI